MKRKLKTWALRVLVALLLLGAAGLAAGNLWLNSASAKGRILARVSGYAPGENASVGRVTFFPWRGLKMRDMRLGDRFQAEAVLAKVDLFSALTKRVEIDELRFVMPVFNIPAAPERAPVPVPARPVPSVLTTPPPAPPVAENDAPAPVPAPAPEPKSQPEPKTQTEGAPASTRRVVMIMRAAMQDGEIVVLGKNGGNVLKVNGLKMDVNLGSGRNASGSLRAERIELKGREIAADCAAELKVAGDTVQFTDMSGESFGGQIGGTVSFRPAQPGAPFHVTMKADKVDLSALVADFGAKFEGVEVTSGVLDGEVRVQGFLRSLPHSVAEAKATVRNGRIIADGADSVRGIELDSDGAVKLEPVTVGAVYKGGQIFLRDATVRSGDTVVKSLGYVSTGGDLNLSTRLYVDDGTRQSLASRARLEFASLGHCGLYFRDFLVRGNVHSPLTDFWEEGTMQPVTQVIGNLRRIAKSEGGGAVATVGVVSGG